jgi:heme-degrading monooxygenase HmoA
MDDWRIGTIVRIWRGRATPAKAASYVQHVVERVFPSLTGIQGHRGAYLLRRETEGQVEFLAVTLWESTQAVRAFAGEQISRAVVEPEARAALIEYDDFVRHFEVIHRSHPQ